MSYSDESGFSLLIILDIQLDIQVSIEPLDTLDFNDDRESKIEISLVPLLYFCSVLICLYIRN